MDILQMIAELKDGVNHARSLGLRLTGNKYFTESGKSVCPVTAAYIKAHPGMTQDPAKYWEDGNIQEWAHERYGTYMEEITYPHGTTYKRTAYVVERFIGKYDSLVAENISKQEAFELACEELLEDETKTEE